MSGPFAHLAGATGIAAPTLRQARTATAEGLLRRREALHALPAGDDVAVVFVGSWGRCEVTSQSDNDFLVLAERDATGADHFVDDVVEVLAGLEGDFKRPSDDGPFAHAHSLAHLHDVLGTKDDVNTTLTVRMLLVLESVAAVNLDFHAWARRETIRQYLEPPVKPNHPPRLFLNDVIRYWRTMCVDFAGKMRERNNQGWGLRNAKLRTTRKMLFASGLLPVMRCVELERDAIEEFLIAQFEMPPVDRVADAFLRFDMLDEAARVFEAYDRFLALLGDSDRRDVLDKIKTRGEAYESEHFQEAVGIGDEIQAGLLALLFSEALAKTTRDFAIF